MLQLLIYVLVIALVAGMIWWLVDYLPVPAPLNKVVKVVTVVIAFIAIIYVLLGLGGGSVRIPS